MEITACAGLVLCGGRSRRMGSRKEFLPFGPELMLPRVVRLVGEAVRPVLVAAAPDQEVPPLPPGTQIVRDRRGDCGPLAGLEAALLALGGRAEAVFVSGCDVPLLRPAVVRRIVELAPPGGIAVPTIAGVEQPLAAVYHAEILPQVESLLASGGAVPISAREGDSPIFVPTPTASAPRCPVEARRSGQSPSGRLSLHLLFDLVPTRRIEARELADCDPQGESFCNVNSPADYHRALQIAGFAPPSGRS